MAAIIPHDRDADPDLLERREVARIGCGSQRHPEHQVGWPALERSCDVENAHPIEEVGKRLRDMMSWIREARKDSSEPGSR